MSKKKAKVKGKTKSNDEWAWKPTNVSKPHIMCVIDLSALPLTRKSRLFHWFYWCLGAASIAQLEVSHYTSPTCLNTLRKNLQHWSDSAVLMPPELGCGRPGMSDVSVLSQISGLSFGSILLSPLLFCLLLLLLLSSLFFSANGPFSQPLFQESSAWFFVKKSGGRRGVVWLLLSCWEN